MFELGLVGDKLGNYAEPPLHGINEQPEERWVEPRQWQCSRTCLARLATAFTWWVSWWT
jgi:hypothetical protein